MEFSETFKISQGTSNAANSVLFSPNSRYICTSEYRQPSRRIGTSVAETLPSWIVRVFEAETLALLHEYTLELPEFLFAKHQNKSVQSATPSNRQFLTGKRSEAAPESTASAPLIGAQIELLWSPNGHFLAAWPVDVPIVFVLAPALKQSTPLLRIEEQAAINISSLCWTPDSRGILSVLSFGLGVKYWRLDCKQAMHLFPYPKNVQEPLTFSADGNFMALLHRRDGVDHIAVYERNSQDDTEGDWSVVHWLGVPDDLNLEGISFARGMGALLEAEDRIPLLYGWESQGKFRFIVYDQDGQVKTQIQPEDLLSGGQDSEEVDSFDKAFLTFGIRKWSWCESGRLACFTDTQENVYLWNAVIHKLMGQISLSNLDALKQQNPIVYKEQVMREAELEKFKYDASFSFPLQSQILVPSGKALESSMSFALSFDGEFLALLQPSKYPNCLWIFDIRSFRLKAVLVQLRAITDFCWNCKENVLALATGSENVYFWQAEGTHCIPYPSSEMSIRALQWHKNAKMMLLSGQNSFCLGIPDILNVKADDSLTY